MKVSLAIFLLLGFFSTIFAQNGNLVHKSFMHDGKVREYYLYTPEGYDGSGQWPLIINYHGYTGDAADQMDRTQMNPMADTARVLVAYPVGLTINLNSGILPEFIPASGSGWCVPGFSTQFDDISFTSALIDSIESSYSIDPARIHTMGLSLGAYMAFYASEQLEDRIASVAGVAGNLTEAEFSGFSLNRRLSALFVHGTGDNIAYFDGLEGKYPSVPAAVAFWASQNNCPVDSQVTELPDLNPGDSTTVSLIRYTGCDENTEVLLYRVNNGGHRYPGSGRTDLPEILGYNNNDINTSSEIIRFFKHNPNPNTTASRSSHLQVPAAFGLEQNFPNPFNPVTTITYHLERPGFVILKIYALSGRHVHTLVKKQQASGTYEVTWNASGFASGVYYYRLEAGDLPAGSGVHLSAVRKMILLR